MAPVPSRPKALTTAPDTGPRECPSAGTDRVASGRQGIETVEAVVVRHGDKRLPQIGDDCDQERAGRYPAWIHQYAADDLAAGRDDQLHPGQAIVSDRE